MNFRKVATTATATTAASLIALATLAPTSNAQVPDTTVTDVVSSGVPQHILEGVQALVLPSAVVAFPAVAALGVLSSELSSTSS